MRRPPHELEITFCDLKFKSSFVASWNMKSDGNLERLRFTACTNSLVVTPYSNERSASSSTFARDGAICYTDRLGTPRNAEVIPKWKILVTLEDAKFYDNPRRIHFIRPRSAVPVENVLSRPMFGGVGLYAGTVFFGIIFHDILYLKVDDQTRAD